MLEHNRRRKKKKKAVASSSSRSASSSSSSTGNDPTNDTKVQTKETILPRSWAQNLSRSYTDLREEYEARKEYFERSYGIDHWDHDDDDNLEITSMDLTMGSSSSYYTHNEEEYNMEKDPKYVLFRHLLREWFAATAPSNEDDATTRGDYDVGEERSVTEQYWPRPWSPNESGYYQNGSIKQVPLMKFPSQMVNDVGNGKAGNAGPSLRTWIQREFRAPTVEERLAQLEEELSKAKEEEELASKATSEVVTDGSGRPKHAPTPTTTSKRNNKKKMYPSSSYIDNEIRVQTAFYTLKELNRKLVWAEKIGFPPPTSKSSSHHHREEEDGSSAAAAALARERKLQRLMQAAKGVTTLNYKHAKPTPAMDGNNTAANDADQIDNKKQISPPPQCGTYLIAHPLMTGYFAKSVIVLLDHAEENKSNNNDNNSTKNKTDEGSSGGTYGLIVNRMATLPSEWTNEYGGISLQRQQWEMLRRNWEEEKVQQQSRRKKEEEQQRPVMGGASGKDGFESSSVDRDVRDSLEGPRVADTVPSSSSSSSSPDTTTTTRSSAILTRRPISLLQAMQDLPESVQMAFGDAPVREGGPVNLSLQMMHRKTSSTTMKESYDVHESVDPNTKEERGEEEEKEEQLWEIGGTQLPWGGTEQHHQHDDGKLTTKDSEETIYFRGDVIKASHEVLDGRSDSDDFSFVIGAACWAPGQLVNEIERGCWLPFHGPPSMAMTGMVDHNDDIAMPSSSSESDNGDDATETGATTGTTQFPQGGPSNTAISLASQQQQQSGQKPGMMMRRPIGDLWLSIMCALGEGEADLAYMMLDNKNVTEGLGDACDNFDR